MNAKDFMLEGDTVQTLTRLGLTLSQVKVYVALVKLEEANAKTISKYSKVARQEAYRVLAELQEKGLVEKIIATPTAFRPVPIEDCVSILIEHKKTEIAETQKEATKLLQELQETNPASMTQEEESRFSLFPEPIAVRRQKAALKALQNNFCLITSCWNRNNVIFTCAEEIAAALKRGVRIRVVTDKPEEETVLIDVLKRLEKYPTFSVKYLRTAPKALISIFDSEEAWVCTGARPELEECPTLLSTNNPILLLILQKYFSTVWVKGVKSNNPGFSKT
jgi:sugar-specific transcriptional regulator TrmB